MELDYYSSNNQFKLFKAHLLQIIPSYKLTVKMGKKYREISYKDAIRYLTIEYDVNKAFINNLIINKLVNGGF